MALQVFGLFQSLLLPMTEPCPTPPSTDQLSCQVNLWCSCLSKRVEDMVSSIFVAKTALSKGKEKVIYKLYY